jgi:transposase
MGIDLATIPNDSKKLKLLIVNQEQKYLSQIEKLEKENEQLERKAEILVDEIRLLRHKIFGRSSEKLTEEEQLQMRLFDEGSEEAQPIETIEVPSYQRRKRGRRPLPESLPRVEVVHDIPEEEKICSCGARLVQIGEDVSEQLEFIPAKIWVARHIRPKYTCKACEGASVEDGEKVIKIAPPPPQMIPKSIATASLLVYVLVSKFCDALPFYRQEKIFRRIGIDIPRATMCRWALEVGRKCEPLIELMHREIRAGPLIQMDETTVQVMNEVGRKNTAKSYMWVIRGGPADHPILLYQYHPSRSAEIPLAYLKDYEGYLHTDGYAGYDDAGRQPGIVHVGCWAHVRRKFIDAQKPSKKAGSAEAAISRIAKLYEIENRLRALKLSDEEFVSRRKEEVEPLLKGFHSWLGNKILQVPPSSLIGKAVGYALRQWGKLEKYLEQAYLTPDTNLVENKIRPFVLGRKNWLFSGSPQGAFASASLFSLIESAKANALEPNLYLRYIFEKLPHAKSEADYRQLLPQNVQAAGMPDPLPVAGVE